MKPASKHVVVLVVLVLLYVFMYSVYIVDRVKLLVPLMRGQQEELTAWSFYNERTISYNGRLMSYVKTKQSSKTGQHFIRLIKESQDLLTEVRERCEKASISTNWGFGLNPVPKPRMLILRPGERILYTSNPKTGSTSFKMFLFNLDGVSRILTGYHDKPRGHYRMVNALKTDTANLSSFRFGQFLKIGAIRNPLTRLLSAFRDKQLRKFELLKPGVDYTEGASDLEIFKLFIDKILLSPKGESNYHLSPQWEQTEVCRWPYDLLIPYERYAEYAELLQDMTNTTSTPYPGSREDKGVDSHSSTYYSDTFYSQLGEGRLKAIYELYELDFRLLGYSKYGDVNFPNLTDVGSVGPTEPL